MSTGDGGWRGVSPPPAGLGRRGSAQGSLGACRRSAAAFLGEEGGAGILDSDPPCLVSGVPPAAAAHLLPACPRVSAPRVGPCVLLPPSAGAAEAGVKPVGK